MFKTINKYHKHYALCCVYMVVCVLILFLRAEMFIMLEQPHHTDAHTHTLEL